MMVYLPVTHVTPNIRDQNCRERLGKSLDHFHSYFLAENGIGNVKASPKNKICITGYRERNISIGNMIGNW